MSVFFSFAGFDRSSCSKAPFVGVGRAIIPRWHFDAASGTCKQFEWSGQTRAGNQNNFACREVCEKMCL